MDTHPPSDADAAGGDLRRIADLLSSVPLFSGFGQPELEAIARACVETQHAKGDVVFREGDAGHTFCVIASGEFEVWSGRQPAEMVSRLGPGEIVGEMTFLLGGPRTATLIASRPATLLSLGKDVFDRFVGTNPTALEHLSRMLCKRLFATSRHRVEARVLTAIGVVGAAGLKGKTFIAEALAALLAEMTGRRALLLTITPEPRRERGGSAGGAPLLEDVARGAAEWSAHLTSDSDRGPVHLTVAIRPSEDHQRHAGDLTALFARLEDRFGFVVVDPAEADEGLARAISAACDRTVVIEAAPTQGPSVEPENGGARPLRVVNLFNRTTAAIPINHCEPFVIPFDSTLTPPDPRELARRIRDDPWSPVARPLYRLARNILGVTVGVALGGGAAFGLAHAGVLQAFEEGGVFVDLIAGTSMGSVIGLAYATGARAPDLVALVRKIGTKSTTISGLLDFTISRPGILAGDRFEKILKPLLGQARTFEDLHLPCRTVATDIESGERVVISSGRLDEAFRASCAAPLLLAPVRRGERILVDGGVTDPVPAEVVREMGADLCIAVNVVPPLRRDVSTALSRLFRTINTINPLAYLARSRGLPSIFDLVMNSLQTLQYELGKFKAISAEVAVNPDLSDFTWLEFYRPDELIERGRAAGERALPEIRKLLEAKLARFTIPRRSGEPVAAVPPQAGGDDTVADLRS